MKEFTDLVVITGFEIKGEKSMADAFRLADALRHRFQMQESRIVSGCPNDLGHLPPGELVSRLDGLVRSRGERNAMMIGYSYGALLALGLACRRRLASTGVLALVDGPLRSDVEVSIPPHLKESFSPFQMQYDCRVNFARQCEEDLSSLDCSPIITLGSSVDKVVPPAAKRLDRITHRDLENKGHDLGRKVEEIVEAISDFVRNTMRGEPARTSVAQLAR